MRVLIDTHLLFWIVGGSSRLSHAARKQIETSDAYVSIASIWELSVKASIGKLKEDPGTILAGALESNLTLLPITTDHALKVATLPQVHRDPFDRMLIAQAMIEPMLLLTNDRTLAACGDFVSVI